MSADREPPATQVARDHDRAIDVVLFDMMDTLIVDPTLAAVRAIHAGSLEDFRELRRPGVWEAFERGEIDEDTFASRYFRDGRPLDLCALKGALRRGYRLVDGMGALVDALRAGAARDREARGDALALHALSNYPCWSDMVDEVTNIGARVPWTFVSWRTGVRKPDAAAYDHAVRTLGASPERCMFVDDRAINCEAARARGLLAHHFCGAEALRDELVALGALAR